METESIATTFGDIYKKFGIQARLSSYLFQSIAKKANSVNISQMELQQARNWFRDEAIALGRADPQKVIETAGSFENMNKLSENSIGKMYLFNYDAKWKDELPYWDRYPLIFPIEYYSNSMLGINLHYLPPNARATLMNALYETINNNKMNKTTKLKINYQVLNSAAKMKFFKPCIKKYLFSHVKSQFHYIKPEYWDYAMMLPLSRFEKASETKVWQDSMAKVK